MLEYYIQLFSHESFTEFGNSSAVTMNSIIISKGIRRIDFANDLPCANSIAKYVRFLFFLHIPGAVKTQFFQNFHWCDFQKKDQAKSNQKKATLFSTNREGDCFSIKFLSPILRSITQNDSNDQLGDHTQISKSSCQNVNDTNIT
jgi:hypothetical protein